MTDEMNLDFEEIAFEDFCEQVDAEQDDPLDALPPAKKSMVFFFVVDVSTSMQGEKIRSLNAVMRDVLPDLVGIGGSETRISVAVLAFSSGFEWITSEPMLLEEYQNWKDLEADGVTDLGAALTELSRKMSRKSFLQAPSLSYAPVVFLLTDGFPTDNYKAGLESLSRNNWFKHGIKIALALGSGVDLDVLKEFTGDPEFVVQADSIAQMKALVRAISVTSSQIGSSSSPVTSSSRELTEKDVEGTKQEAMKEALKGIKEDIMASDPSELEGLYESGW